MAKKPHSEVRWVNKYAGEDGKPYFGGMLAYEPGLLGDPHVGMRKTVRVRVTELPPAKRKGKKRGK